MTNASPKRQLLIGGRRIRISDLVQSGLLHPGEVLVFNRPRVGQRFEAVVQEDGALTVEGQRYTSPSSAARAVAEVSLDGWHAWQVGDSGPYLHKLRETLLDRETRNLAENHRDGDLRRRQEFLATIDEDGESIAVRDLLKLWGTDSRKQTVTDVIDADLANHDLLTTPHYLKVGVDDHVRLHRRASDSDTTTDDVSVDPLGLDEVGITLGNIRSASSSVVSCRPDSSLEEAITLMYLYDYSQLPVISGQRTLKGAVTWKSIARARHRNPDATLGDATVDAPQRSYDTELIDVLADLQSHDFVIVRGPEQNIAGIVTAADVVDAYGALATPFLLIGELDQILRRVLASNVDIEKVGTLCRRPEGQTIDSFAKLSMGDYETVLSDEAVWKSLDWPFDRKIFTKNLSELREVRNDIMHFNRDSVPDHTISRLRQMILLLREYASAD